MKRQCLHRYELRLIPGFFGHVVQAYCVELCVSCRQVTVMYVLGGE